MNPSTPAKAAPAESPGDDDDAAAGEDAADDDPGPPSKKAEWLRDKGERHPVRLKRAPRPNQPPAPVLTLHNVWTDESLPLTLDARGLTSLPKRAFDWLVRCHYTNQVTAMDQRLLPVLVRAANRFHSRYLELVSGYRAPKYQLLLRKKGHEVARDSQHPRGQAIDFRIPEVPTRRLLGFVKSLHLGGVGFYPESRFVHADVGPVRFWRGH